ncbi:MAG: flagellar motor switch protein FliN [Desulfobacterales bacterium]|nr:flagellar motor switch protein FliN [Desulfobacterales bacterium]
MPNEQGNDIIYQVKDAVIELFDTMLSMAVEPTDSDPPPREDEDQLMVGFLSLAGKVQGSVSICVTQAMALRMSAGMLGMEIEEVEDGEEVRDVLREVCNITAGGLKSNFCDAGLTCEISTPSITVGSNFQIQTLNMERYERFNFAVGDEFFHVEVAVKFVAEDEEDLKSILQLKKIDINRFQRLDIISSVGDSIIELFDTMLSLDVELSDREPFCNYEDFKVMGAIDFTGNVKGSIQFQVPKLFGRMIAAGVLGEELEQIQDIETVKDVIGEMTNILGGNLKAAFCDSGLPCQISTPSLTVGIDFQIEILNMDRYEKFAFKLNDHDILVEVCVKIEEGEGTPASAAAAPAHERLNDAAIQDMLAAAEEDKTENTADDGGGSETLDNDAIQALLANPDVSADGEQQAASPEETKTSTAQTTPLPDAEPDSVASAAGAETPADKPALPFDVGFIRDIPVHISVELGRRRMAIKDVMALGHGSAVVLANLEGELLDIRANNRLIAKGEVLVENDKYGIRIREIIASRERLDQLMR